jgi:hypothetical protein
LRSIAPGEQTESAAEGEHDQQHAAPPTAAAVETIENRMAPARLAALAHQRPLALRRSRARK